MDAVIEVVGTEELPAIIELYNQIFRPPRDIDSSTGYLGRYNVLQMLATVKDKPVGFFLGFELKPTTYFAWFYGVHPDFRRQGVATQLMEAAHEWTRGHGYHVMPSNAQPSSSALALIDCSRIRHCRHSLG